MSGSGRTRRLGIVGLLAPCGRALRNRGASRKMRPSTCHRTGGGAEKHRRPYQPQRPPGEKSGPLYRPRAGRAEKCRPLYRLIGMRVEKCHPLYQAGRRGAAPPRPARYTRRHFSAWGGTPGGFSRHGVVRRARFPDRPRRAWYRGRHFSTRIQKSGTAGSFSRHAAAHSSHATPSKHHIARMTTSSDLSVIGGWRPSRHTTWAARPSRPATSARSAVSWGEGRAALQVRMRRAPYSLSPAVICVAEMSSPASEASRHFQSVKAGWS